MSEVPIPHKYKGNEEKELVLSGRAVNPGIGGGGAACRRGASMQGMQQVCVTRKPPATCGRAVSSLREFHAKPENRSQPGNLIFQEITPLL
jgi:hypothetical protein